MGGPLTDEEIKDVREVCPFVVKTAVETGTYKGHSAKLLATNFGKVHTIEIHEPLFHEAQENNKDINNITYHLGDTLQLLPGIVKNTSTEPCLYFIDAHISGCDSSWNKEDKCPLFKELDIIIANSTNREVVFIFDDLRLFDSNEPWYTEWKGVNTKTISDKLVEAGWVIGISYQKNDRYYVYTV